MSNADFVMEEMPAGNRLAQGLGHVVEVDAGGDTLILRTADGLIAAVRAASCLLVPAPDDRVAWLDAGDGGRVHVIAVLERCGRTTPTIGVPSDAVIQSGGGTLGIQADALALRSREFSLEAERAGLSADQVTGVGGRVSWSFGVVKLTADLLETFAERVLQFSRWSRRLVDGPDQVRSRQIDWRAEHSLQLQSQVIIADAEKLLKADGDQIHLG